MPARWLERALLAIGVVCLGIYAYVFVDARLTERAESRRLDEAIRRHRQQQAADTDSFSAFQPRAGRSGESALAPPPPRLAEGELVGRLEIPRLGVSAIVLEGVGSGTLRHGIGHIPGTDFPVSAGNVGIAGHRDTFFRPLKDIQKDDVIRLQTPEGTYRYRVDSTRIVLPEDGAVLAEPGPALTLVTCYPFYYVGSAPKRFIVRAREIGSEDASGGRAGGQR